MKAEAVLYNSMLRCMHLYNRGTRYELPAHYVGKIQNYFLYYRPTPIIHHFTKDKKFLLPYPEVVLVGDSLTHHCISIGFQDDQAKNMYVNINLPPKEHSNGHQWEDLELDLKIKVDPTGFQVSIVDVDEFIAATALTQEHRKLAWQEISILVEKIKERQFPFDHNLEKILSYAKSGK